MLSTSNLARSRYVGLTLLVINRAEHNNKRSLNCNYKIKKHLIIFLINLLIMNFGLFLLRFARLITNQVKPTYRLHAKFEVTVRKSWKEIIWSGPTLWVTRLSPSRICMLSTSNLARSRYVGLTLLVINRAEHNNKRSLNCNYKIRKHLIIFLINLSIMNFGLFLLCSARLKTN